MGIFNNAIDWANKFGSICNAPIEPIYLQETDSMHPAIVFDTYWKSLAYNGLPDRSSLILEKVISILKWVMIFDCEKNESVDQYYLRLQGTAAEKLTCGKFQGSFLHEFTSGICYKSRQNEIRKVLSEMSPSFARINLGDDSEFSTTVTLGIFPISNGPDKMQVFIIPAPDSNTYRDIF